jgi:hypothetical protein
MNASREKELSRVGEVAERLGVSPRTIKYYEELGLIKPEARSSGGSGSTARRTCGGWSAYYG